MSKFIWVVSVFFLLEAAACLYFLAIGDREPTSSGVRSFSIAICVGLAIWGLLLVRSDS